eukprot:12735191-Prorocentrum_lima.AAC.1
MTSSLVGSEMCIRDRHKEADSVGHAPFHTSRFQNEKKQTHQRKKQELSCGVAGKHLQNAG